MKRCTVWHVVKKSQMPKGVCLLGAKWAFNHKKSGVCRACLVAKGWDQIPGVDCTENFASVINDASIRSALVLWLVNDDWIAVIVDVETTFLHGMLI